MLAFCACRSARQPLTRRARARHRRPNVDDHRYSIDNHIQSIRSEETQATYGYAIASYTAPTEAEGAHRRSSHLRFHRAASTSLYHRITHPSLPIIGLDQLDFNKGQKLKLYNRHKDGVSFCFFFFLFCVYFFSFFVVARFFSKK
jgi:hypothetical protein